MLCLLLCISPDLKFLTEICKSVYMSAQLLFHVRLDPLKLPRDPLKVVAGRARDPIKILANGSPEEENFRSAQNNHGVF